MSLWRSSGPACAAFLLACTKLNRAFDLDTNEGGLSGDSSNGPGTPPTGTPPTGTVAQVDAALLCAQDGPTPACKTGCVVGGEDSIVQNSCQAGICTPLAVTGCGKYKCKDAVSCHSTCDNNGDCKVGFCTEAQLCQ